MNQTTQCEEDIQFKREARLVMLIHGALLLVVLVVLVFVVPVLSEYLSDW